MGTAATDASKLDRDERERDCAAVRAAVRLMARCGRGLDTDTKLAAVAEAWSIVGNDLLRGQAQPQANGGESESKGGGEQAGGGDRAAAADSEPPRSFIPRGLAPFLLHVMRSMPDPLGGERFENLADARVDGACSKCHTTASAAFT